MSIGKTLTNAPAVKKKYFITMDNSYHYLRRSASKLILLSLFISILCLVPAHVTWGAMISMNDNDQVEGYCEELGRRLSKAELIRSALDELNSVSHVTILIDGLAQHPYPHVPYSSGEEILSLYPNCCEVVPAEDWKTWAPENRPGTYAVRAKFPRRYKDSDGSLKTQDLDVTLPLTSCGKSPF